MRRMGLGQADYDAFLRALRSFAHVAVEVEVQNLAGRTLSTISHRVVAGEVAVNMGGEVTRRLSMTLADPGHTLNLDTDSPDAGALFMDRMLAVSYVVGVPELDDEVSVPVFVGPVMKLDRDGDLVMVEADGKERLALGELWRPLTLRKGMRKVAAIRTIMSDRAGETRFSFPASPVRLPRTRSLTRWDKAWPVSRRMASTFDRQLFYPGNGVCTMRGWPRRPLFTFGPEDVTGEVSVSYTMENLRNTVVVVGGVPKGQKRRVRATATAPRNHPLSPWRLGRNGQQLRLVEKIEDDAIRSQREADRKANRVLNDRLKASVDVKFESIPMPHLDEGDWVQVDTGSTVLGFRLREFTIPLALDGDPTTTVGYLKRRHPSRKAIRR